MRQMCILEKLNFKISGGSMPPDPPSVLAPSALVPSFAGPTMGNSHCILIRQKYFFLFFTTKESTFRIINKIWMQGYYNNIIFGQI